MNKIINKIFPIITLAFVLALSSCLNDSDYANNLIGTKKNQVQNFVEVHLTSAESSNIVSRAYPVISNPAGRDTTIVQFIPVHLTEGVAKTDITVTYKFIDTSTSAVIDSLVNIDGLVFDNTKLTVNGPALKIVIPAGSSTGYLSVTLNANKLIGNTFVFGIRITGISDTNYKLSNLTDGIVKYGPANDYDGQYSVDGEMVDISNAKFKGNYPMVVNLITQSVTTNAMWDTKVNGGLFGHGFLNDGTGSYYGTFSPLFKFDPATNKIISVTNYYVSPANGRSAELDPSGINTFDPATKTIKVSYWMNQPGFSPHRTHFVEEFTYIGPR